MGQQPLRSERTMAMLRAHISEIMENKLIVQLVTQTAVGPEGYADLKDAALEKAIQYTEELAEDSGFNREQARVVQSVSQKSLRAEFAGLVRLDEERAEVRMKVTPVGDPTELMNAFVEIRTATGGGLLEFAAKVVR